MNRVVSVHHKLPSQQPPTKHQLLAAVEQLSQKQGFLHYRLVKISGRKNHYTLLTFWQSSKHYRQALR